MNQEQSTKYSFSLILLVILLTGLIVGSGVYLWQKSYNKKLQAQNQQLQQEIKELQDKINELQNQIAQLQERQGTQKSVNWENLIPIIRKVIGPTFLGIKVEERGAINIYKTSDITGNGIPEALVGLGQGGAYTGYLTLMRIESDKPVLAQFKKKDRKISPMMFLEGASVMNGKDVVMLPEKNTIYQGSWSISTKGKSYGKFSDCRVEAYQWNPHTKVFEFNQNLSDEIRSFYCDESLKKNVK